MNSPALNVLDGASAWSPIDLQEAVSGDYSGPMPSLLRRSDDKWLMYPGRLHSIAGTPGGGKSWIAQVVSAQILQEESNVLYVDFEDTAESVVGRLKILGVPDKTILGRFGYVSPSEPFPPKAPGDLRPWIDATRLVVLDGVTDAMTLNQWNPLDNKDAAEFMQRLVGPLASGAGRPAVLLVDHVTKSKDDRGQYAIGAQHKLAAVQVQFTVETTTPFDQDHDGTIALSVTKDRYGQVQRLTDAGASREIAQFHFRHPIPGSEAMTVYIDPPAGQSGAGTLGFDPSMLRAILDVIGKSEEGLNKTQIKDLVTGRDANLVKALSHLTDSGFVEASPFGRSTVWKLTQRVQGVSPGNGQTGTDADGSDGVPAPQLAPLPSRMVMPGVE